MKPARAIRHQTFAGEGTSFRSSESLDTVFPELQQLPREAKLPIRNFLREQISKFKGGEGIPRKMLLLAEAFEEVEEDDGDNEERDPKTESGGGPYGTVLHTAAAVDNCWLVKLQIKAGVDVSAFDAHFWTALMVATAQGHPNCIKPLCENTDTRKLNAAPRSLPPSSLVKAEPKLSVSFGQRNLTAATGSWSSLWLQKRIQLRSDHPIPPHFPTFYYEITILNNGPLGYVMTSYLPLI